MCNWRSAYRSASALAALLLTTTPTAARAADIYVPAGGNLQAAINSAKGGDTIVLQPGATYVGNFKLPVHGGSEYVTIRTAANDQLPPEGTRTTPAHLPYLATIRSPNTTSAMKTAPGAAYWRLLLVAFQPNVRGYSDVLELGDGSSAQNQLSQVPHHLIVDRVYMTGDRLHGQKRGIALNSGDTTIVNSWIVEMKAIGQDSQAIGGWNGPGPYRIENNHLEGAGEVVMLGGDDPKIPNLTPSDVIFRANTLTRPLSWRHPIVPTPESVRASASLGGTLAAGTYAYRVVARRPVNSTTAKSSASTEVRVAVGAGARVTVEWDAVPDATEYLVYGRSPAAQNAYWVVKSTSFTDDGTTAGTAGTPSSSGTVWTVKNLFELKHARRVLVAYNLMENNWAAAQRGSAILLSPRNAGGTCVWCQVEDITFEYNVFRHIGSGIKISGFDDTRPTLQTTNVIVRHNEFSDLGRAWGDSGQMMILLSGPRNVTVDHNTIVSSDGSGVVMVDQAPVEGFRFTNNVARHNSYGIQGSGKGYGNTAIAYYFPGGVVSNNVFAGGSASRYPAGNRFPSLSEFEHHFIDYAGSNFRLRPGTDWEGAGTDGLDLGADYAAMEGRTGPRVETLSLPSATQTFDYSVKLEVTGGRAPYQWTVRSGSLPDGLELDVSSGVIRGSATVYGSATFTVQVEDFTGAITTQPFTLHVEPAPVKILTEGVAQAIATVSYMQRFKASGGEGTYKWSVIGGTLPLGLSLTTQGVLFGTPITTAVSHAQATPVTYAFTVGVVDPADDSRSASRPFTLTVVPPPNKAPKVAMTAPANGAMAQVGAPITLAAQATDEDGTVARVDFYLGEAVIGSGVAPAFTTTWVAPTSGTFTLSAVAIDDKGAPSAAASVSIGTKSEIVLRASQVTKMAGNFTLNADASAAGGFSLWLVNKSLAKVPTAVAAPVHYAEFTFYAEAGRPYRLWMRGKAEDDRYSNDSVFVQFDGVSSAQIGTTSSMSVNLEDGGGVGVSGWGWQDNGYGVGVLGPQVVFTRTGRQTMRIQNREDGLMIDQIVLSPEQFLTAAPGALHNDTTILSQ